MKVKHVFTGCAVFFAVAILSACEHEVGMESIVHEDGSIERTILLSDADSALIVNNMFDATPAKGWSVEATRMKKGEAGGKEEVKMDLILHKNFASADEANRETDVGLDTLFSVQSTFNEKFRWFYTYIRYSDTYRAVNRFRTPATDYFTVEDFDFIKRLPPRGVTLSLADSIYESRLDEKISELFITRAYFEDVLGKVSSAMAESKMDKKWADTLARNKEKLYAQLVKSDDVDHDRLMQSIMDSLNIPARPEAYELYRSSVVELEKRIDFMSEASSGKYAHHIRIPWAVMNTNADSVRGGDLYWKPRTTKFLLSDYEMYAETRKLNYWTVVVSALVVAGGGWALRIRRKRSQ